MISFKPSQLKVQKETEKHQEALNDQLKQAKKELAEVTHQLTESLAKGQHLEAQGQIFHQKIEHLSGALKASIDRTSEEQSKTELLEAEVKDLRANLTGKLLRI